MNFLQKTIFLLLILVFVFSPLSSAFADDNLVATISGSGASAIVRTVATDHLTGSNIITNSAGAVEELADYYPYGDIRLDEKSGSFSEQRKFAGHEYDADTGLSYMNARYYDGKVGRFASQDPLVMRNPEKFLDDPQGLNMYSYVKNNPLRYVDPTGKLWKEFFESYIQNISNVVTMATPFISDARDAYELNANRDLISQRQLTQNEKQMTGLGAFVPFALSGKEVRAGSNILNGIDTTKITNKLSDSLSVCRGGTCTIDRFEHGSGVIKNIDGTLSGVSVTSKIGASVKELVKNLPGSYTKYGLTTVGNIRKLGGDVIKNADNSYHATVNNLSSKQLESLFTPIRSVKDLFKK